MQVKTIGLLAAAYLALPLSAEAAPARTQSGVFKGAHWRAESSIIGQTSTATIAGGGNPIYLATANKYRGTIGLLMDYGAGGQFVCSGSLTADRQSIITAGHCVSDGGKGRPNSVTAYFYDPSKSTAAETPVYAPGAEGVVTVAIDQIHVNPLYTGEVIDQNDISVLHLASKAPKFATGYELYTAGDLTGSNFNLAGYGRRSDTGGSVGADLGTGRLRQGNNRYDFRLGDSDFNGFFDGGPNGFFGAADTRYSYIADFDNGLAKNDGSCLLATGPGGLGVAPSGKYCNLGRGATEAATAGGDSGGPQFIDGKLASVTSYGLTFGSDYGDIDDKLDDSFGEFSGYVPIFTNAAFIAGVPEPMSWTLMIGGFGLVGATLRRARKAVAA